MITLTMDTALTKSFFFIKHLKVALNGYIYIDYYSTSNKGT